MNNLFQHAWVSSPERLAVAVIVTVGFAALARIIRGVSRSGTIAGAASCFLLFAGGGPPAFATLAVLFALTWISTRQGRGRKQALGLAERGDGRNARQVLANLAVAAAASCAYAVTGGRLWLLAMTSALAEAAADTAASEIGQSRSQTAFLVTNWKRVAAGTDGGVTLAGSCAAAVAGVVIAVTAAAGGLVPWRQCWIPAAAGFAGMLVDSLLGATFQRKGWMSNEAVNLFGTLAAALAILIFNP